MHLPPTTVAFLTVFSFSSISAGQPRPSVIRVPLERKSFIAGPPPDHDWSGVVNNAAGHVNTDFLKTQMANVEMKYRRTLAAYELNTGYLHPLARAFSEIGSPGTILPAGKLKKRRRRDDAFDTLALGNPGHVPRGRLTKRDDISLTEVNSNLWMGAMSAGTPPQNFLVAFDTGSSDLILPDQDCDSTCDGHTRYNHTSSTSISLGNTFQLAYAGGSSVNGTQYADNVYMGGYEAVNQTFGAATTYSTGLQNPTFPPDGLLGMGFPQISILNTSPVFQTIISSGTVTQSIFSFALSSESGKSELTIGGTNTNMYQEATTEYIGVAPLAFWQIPLAGVSRPGLDGAPDVVVVNKTSYAQAIIDTGTTLIVATDKVAQVYYANVTGAKPCSEIGYGVWSVPCDIIGSLAPTFTFGSRNFTVSSSIFNQGPVSPGSTDCIAGIAGGGNGWWIIGDVFLQNVYTIFDVGNGRVGFADLA